MVLAASQPRLPRGDRAVTEAEGKLSSLDFDRFETDEGALEDKVRHGKPRLAQRQPQAQPAGDALPEPLNVQKGDDFFRRPISN